MTDLYEGVEFLSDSDQEIFIDEVRLGLAESPLRAQLPALRVAATEERDLQPHPLRVAVRLLQADTLVKCGGVSLLGPHLVHQDVIAVPQEVVVRDQSLQGLSDHVDVDGGHGHTQPGGGKPC